MKKQSVWIALLFLPAFASAAQQQRITFSDAISYALEHSPTMDSARREAYISELDSKNAFSQFLPSLDLDTSHGIQKSSPATRSSPWASDFSLTLSETLFDNGQTITKYHIADIKSQQAKIQLQKNTAQLIRDVGVEYFRYSLYTKLLEIQKNKQEQLEKQFRLVSESYKHGLKTQKDYLRFKTQLSRAKIDTISSQNTVLKSKKALNRLLALPDDQSADYIVYEKIPSERNLSPLRLIQHYETKISDMEKKIIDLDISLISRKRWPELSFTAKVGYNSSDYWKQGYRFDQKDSLEWNALVGLQFNIWDWGIRKRDAEISMEKGLIRENEIQSTLLGVRENLDQVAIDLQESKENFALSDELLKLEGSNLELLQREYRQGKVGYLDYITGLNDFSSAKIKYYSSLYAFHEALINYRYHQGTLHEFQP